MVKRKTTSRQQVVVLEISGVREARKKRSKRARKATKGARSRKR